MRKKLVLLGSIFVAATLLVTATKMNDSVLALVPGINTMVSVNNSGDGQGGNSTSNGSQNMISANGQYIVFQSSASNLIAGDTNGKKDVFLRDLNNSTTTRINTSVSNVEANNDSQESTISETGRYVAFSSTATNLIDGTTVTGGYEQIYLKDVFTNAISIVTQKSDGTLGNGSSARVISVSNDGRFVLWSGVKNTNLNPSGGANPAQSHTYLADLKDRSFILLGPLDSTTTGSVNAGKMSCDGSFVVINAFAKLFPDDTDSVTDVYLIDIRNGLSYTNLTSISNKTANGSSISCNGNYITFKSTDPIFSNLIPSTDTKEHAIRYDRINNTYDVADIRNGTLGNNQISATAVDDAGNVLFGSNATNFSSNAQVYLKNFNNGALEIVSSTVWGSGSNGAWGEPSISSNGKRAAYNVGTYANSVFAPNAGAIFTADTNGYGDVVMSLTGL